MLLHFQDLSKLKTKKVIFEGTYYARDSGTLEQLKELSSRRRAVEDCVNGSSSVTEAIAREMAGGITSRIQQDLQKLEFYLPLLENLLIYVQSMRSNNQIHQWTADLKIRWTSALNGSSSFSIGGPKFFRIDDLQYELAMILFLYGSLQRERAVELLSSGAEFFVESASLYRKAAGVFENLAQNVLPNLQPKLPPERPPEVMPVISSALCLVCLADAQGNTPKTYTHQCIRRIIGMKLIAFYKIESALTVCHMKRHIHNSITLFINNAERFLSEYISTLFCGSKIQKAGNQADFRNVQIIACL